MSDRMNYSSFTQSGPRPINEDSLGVWELDNNALLVAIADGLGGMGGGKIASELAISEFYDYMTSEGYKHDQMSMAIKRIHQDILIKQKNDVQLSKMATTLTAGILFQDRFCGVHCGDSRAVIARGSGIKRLTKDQTEAQKYFDQGKITKEELKTYPRRHILASAIGSDRDPEIQEFSIDIKPKDRIVLTTDGVHERVFLRELRNLIVISKSAKDFTEILMKETQSRFPDDNFSAIAVFCE